MQLQIINPLEYPGWDDLLLTNDKSSFFHSSAWARVLSESYKYNPVYFCTIENDRISTLFPIMEVNSLITGRRGVSLPFTDYCDLILPETDRSSELFEKIIEYGKRAGWKYIEWRASSVTFRNMVPSNMYYGHILNLLCDEKPIQSRFRSSTRRNIKKSEKEGVKAERTCSLEAVKEFYRLHCMTRKHHGLPPQPFSFFRNIHEFLLSREKGFVVLASHDKRNIAGAIYLHFGDKAIFKYGAFDRRFQHLRPNNIVMWEAIKWYVKNGFREFSFGRTDVEEEGLLQYKRGWGVKEETVKYFRYDLTKSTFIKDELTINRFAIFFSKLPSPLTKLAGSLLYKHVG